jgi:hypothetical protein
VGPERGSIGAGGCGSRLGSRRDCESEGVTGGVDEEAVEPDAELVVVELEVDPGREVVMEAEDVAEGERERSRRSGADVGARDDEAADEEAVTDRVGGIADDWMGVDDGYFTGRPRGRLTLIVVADDTAWEAAAAAVGSLAIGAKRGAGTEAEGDWESYEMSLCASTLPV